MSDAPDEAYDSVVMLTWSDWKTEPRSNRFHYASRFARRVPVLFVQPDDGDAEPAAGAPGVTLLHAGARHDAAQLAPVAAHLRARGLLRPLVWQYSPRYAAIDAHFPRALRVLHATEDYFSDSTFLDVPSGPARYAHRRAVLEIRRGIVRAVHASDLVLCVSDGVAEGIRANCSFGGEVRVVENGCDFAFWSAGAEGRAARPGRTAVYQGGINERLDTDLMLKVMRLLPDWSFRFYGQSATGRVIDVLRAAPNFSYMGPAGPEALRAALRSADVGLMPYRQLPDLTSRLFPLKAFEYAACGLPVVSVPLEALARFPGVFAFARTAEEFAAAMAGEAANRDDAARKADRIAAARAQDYERRFAEVQSILGALRRGPRTLRGSRTAVASLFVREQWNRVLARATRAARL